MGRHLAIIGSAVIALSLITGTPPANASAIRYASHTAADGSGAPCTQAAPCSLHDAVTAASAGDTVQLTADEYYLDTQLDITVDDLTIRGPEGIGEPGSFVAYIFFRDQASGGAPDTASKLRIFANNTHFERVAITGVADGAAALVGSGNASKTGQTYDRVLISNRGQGDALVGHEVSVVNSIVQQTAAGTAASAAVITGTIMGSTIYSADGTAILVNDNYILPGTSCSLSIRNTLAWGADANLALDDRGLGCASLAVDYDYSWIPATLGGGIRTLGASTPVALPRNLADTPAVFDPTDSYLGNWVLPVNSPAIDAGCSGASCSDHDYYGRPRPIGTANDIGPMEQSLPPAVTRVRAASITSSDARLTADVTPHGSATTYTLQWRRPGGEWTTAASGSPTDAFSPAPVTATVTLSAGTDYETRIVATNDRGTTSSGITAFRSTDPGITLQELRAKVTKKRARLLSKATVTGAGRITQKATARARARCSTAGQVSTAGTYRLTCTLTKKSRAALREAHLRLRVMTRFQPASGAPVSATSRISIPKRR